MLVKNIFPALSLHFWVINCHLGSMPFLKLLRSANNLLYRCLLYVSFSHWTPGLNKSEVGDGKIANINSELSSELLLFFQSTTATATVT